MENIWEEFDALNRTVSRQAKLIGELLQRLTKLEQADAERAAQVNGNQAEPKAA